MKGSPKLFCDETRCPVLDPGRGKTKTGYLWAIARDDRPWGGTDPPAVWTSPDLVESRCLLLFVDVERRLEGGRAFVARLECRLRGL